MPRCGRASSTRWCVPVWLRVLSITGAPIRRNSSTRASAWSCGRSTSTRRSGNRVPGGASSIVCLRNVCKTFESGTVALDGLDLAVRDGEFVSLLGPSGCGKSTALRIVAGLSAPSIGTVEWPAGAGRIGFVFQEPTLMPWADVAANVRLPLRLAHAGDVQARDAVHQALERVGLAGFPE